MDSLKSSSIKLNIADVLMHGLHISIIIFCGFGWLFPSIAPWHLALNILILLSWFGLGWYKSLGYCLITDIHWNIKAKKNQRPETELYIKYVLDRAFRSSFSEHWVSMITSIIFAISLIGSIAQNIYLYL